MTNYFIGNGVRAAALAYLGLAAWGQSTTSGTLNVTVLDQSGAVVPGAALELKDLSTNDVRRAATQAGGAYGFPNLPFGLYQLTVSAQGFQTQVFGSVRIQTGRETDVHVTLKVGTTAESVTVTTAETPLVETESSTLAFTIDTKQVENLPVLGRSAWNLVYLTPGWASTGNNSSSGTFNNMPGGAIVAADFDGTPGISNRMRSGGYGYGTTVVQPRLENIAEMTVQTAQLDLSGNGTSAMRISIVSRRGANDFHGRLYEDFRNTVLNANSWINNARGVKRSVTKLNEFGGSLGGPIIRNKLFFFGTWAERKQPNTGQPTASVLNSPAQQGIFQYKDPAGNLQSINVFDVARRNGLPAAIHPNIAGQLQAINGVLNQGILSQGSDPNLSTFVFTNPSSTTVYYPTLRVDYNVSENLRFNVSYTQNKTSSPNTYAPIFPKIDTVDRTSYLGNNKIAGVGVDWVIRPTLVNQFRAGFMYQYSAWDPENSGLDLSKIHSEAWGMGQSVVGSNTFPRTFISSYYPQFNFSDSVSWQRGLHTIVAGGTWFREQDHYWNGPGGWPIYSFGLASSDPAYAAFTNAMPGVNTNLIASARALYATLSARVSSVNIAVGRPLDMKTKQYAPYGAYNLNEVQQSGGFWVQDRWRLRPNFTVNYGLRWDIVGDNYDKDGAYSSVRSPADLWGPTPIGAMFKPGTLGGVQDPQFVARTHVYRTSWKNPQPAVALAWGRDQTVIRAGYALRNYQEGAQNFWAFASNSGAFFYQGGNLSPDPAATGAGYFRPGSLTYGDPLPPYLLTPARWSPQVSASQMWGNSFWTMNPEIRQPYIQQWNFGVQRQLPSGSAVEIRYVGNLTLHSWFGINLNEVNIAENGFLPEFRNAQRNLQLNQAGGKGNTAFNNGLPGQTALPILTAAFGNNASASGWTAYTTQLLTGAAGSMARSIANTKSYFCNMVASAAFAPCATIGNFAGAGYPINFWGINPYAMMSSLNYLDAAGTSNYHGLQMEMRQRMTHGAQFNVSYTWAHSLGLASVNNIQSQGGGYMTNRNGRLSYGPTTFDIRNIFRASGTYDLPFWKGKPLLGGWTIGLIAVVQTGNPSTISGGYATVNNNDAGVVFNGITANDFQGGIAIRKSGNPWVTTFDPRYIGANGMANPSYVTPAATPGAWGYRPTFWAPKWWNTDLSVTKTIPIREKIKCTLQGSALNAFNHPTFGMGTLNIQNIGFGQATSGSARNIELRANLEF